MFPRAGFPRSLSHALDELEQSFWHKSCWAPELTQTTPASHVRGAIRLRDRQLLAFESVSVLQVDMINQIELVSLLARPLVDVFDQAEKTNAPGNGADFLPEFARDRLLSCLPELDSTRQRYGDDITRARIVVLPNEDPVSFTNHGGCDRPDPLGQPL